MQRLLPYFAPTWYQNAVRIQISYPDKRSNLACVFTPPHWDRISDLKLRLMNHHGNHAAAGAQLGAVSMLAAVRSSGMWHVTGNIECSAEWWAVTAGAGGSIFWGSMPGHKPAFEVHAATCCLNVTSPLYRSRLHLAMIQTQCSLPDWITFWLEDASNVVTPDINMHIPSSGLHFRTQNAFQCQV